MTNDFRHDCLWMAGFLCDKIRSTNSCYQPKWGNRDGKYRN